MVGVDGKINELGDHIINEIKSVGQHQESLTYYASKKNRISLLRNPFNEVRVTTASNTKEGE